MQAIRENVLLRPLPTDEKSAGGILVPESFRRTGDRCQVVSCGRGTAQHPMRYQVGQIVYRIQGAGTELEVQGEKLYLLNQQDILSYE